MTLPVSRFNPNIRWGKFVAFLAVGGLRPWLVGEGAAKIFAPGDRFQMGRVPAGLVETQVV
jgi:hypothetical protein